MIIEILMPALSPTMTDGTLSKWLKNEGDKVAPGDVIAEIETDKATMEVEAVDEGILGKILVPAGTNNVLVGKAIALILEEESDREGLASYSSKENTKIAPQASDAAPPEKSSEVSKSNNDSTVISNGDRVFASPLARRIAEQNGVDISKVTGSGPKGRVVKSDVLSAPKAEISSQSQPRITGSGETKIIPLSNMRRVIAKRLLESKQNVPHFYLSVECNLDRLLSVREEINHGAEGVDRVSVNDFVIKAVGRSLRLVEEANTSWTDDGIIQYMDVDVSVAVAIEGGLVTPIIRSADQKSLSEISKEMKSLAQRAREGKLKPEEYQGGSFSISNLGMFGIKQFNAIINPPQSCILAVGAGIKKPTIVGNEIKISTICEMTLSCDHRVVDGAVGAKFLSTFKEFIENPVKVLV